MFGRARATTDARRLVERERERVYPLTIADLTRLDSMMTVGPWRADAENPAVYNIVPSVRWLFDGNDDCNDDDDNRTDSYGRLTESALATSADQTFITARGRPRAPSSVQHADHVRPDGLHGAGTEIDARQTTRTMCLTVVGRYYVARVRVTTVPFVIDFTRAKRFCFRLFRSRVAPLASPFFFFFFTRPNRWGFWRLAPNRSFSSVPLPLAFVDRFAKFRTRLHAKTNRPRRLRPNGNRWTRSQDSRVNTDEKTVSVHGINIVLNDTFLPSKVPKSIDVFQSSAIFLFLLSKR